MTAAKTRKVARKATPKKTFDIVPMIRQFLTLKVQAEVIEDRMGDLKKDLQAYVESAGYEDDKGNYWLDLDEPVDVDGFGSCGKLKKERRVTQSVDEDRAEGILRDKGLFEECTTTIVVLDEEEIRKAHFKGLLSDADIDAIFPSKISYAFRPVKA